LLFQQLIYLELINFRSDLIIVLISILFLLFIWR